MIKSSDYLSVSKGNFKYLFFVVGDSYWIHSNYANSLIKVLEDTFARNIGRTGAVIISFNEDTEDNYRKVMSKPWPQNIKELLEDPRDPCVLTIATDFEKFDPSKDRYFFITLKEYRGNNEQFIDLLREIENVIASDSDLFTWWEQRASKQKQFLQRIRMTTELKPGIWGFSLNLKKFFNW